MSWVVIAEYVTNGVLTGCQFPVTGWDAGKLLIATVPDTGCTAGKLVTVVDPDPPCDPSTSSIPLLLDCKGMYVLGVPPCGADNPIAFTLLPTFTVALITPPRRLSLVSF